MTSQGLTGLNRDDQKQSLTSGLSSGWPPCERQFLIGSTVIDHNYKNRTFCWWAECHRNPPCGILEWLEHQFEGKKAKKKWMFTWSSGHKSYFLIVKFPFSLPGFQGRVFLQGTFRSKQYLEVRVNSDQKCSAALIASSLWLQLFFIFIHVVNPISILWS